MLRDLGLRPAVASVDTVHLAYRDPNLSVGWFAKLPWKMTHHRTCTRPGDELGDPPVAWDEFVFQGAIKRKAVRVRAYIGGDLHGLIVVEFEVATVLGRRVNFRPVPPSTLADIPRRLARLLDLLGIEHVAREGVVTRLDLAVQFQIADEDEWDRFVDVAGGLRDHYGLADLYRGRRFRHPDPSRPKSVTGLGMCRKSIGLKVASYRIDLRHRHRPDVAAMALMVGKIEFRLIGEEIEAAMSPFAPDRRLPHVLGGLRFADAVSNQLRRLGLDHVADPAALTDDEAFDLCEHPRLVPRLRSLLADCRARGVAAVRKQPPVMYQGNKRVLNEDINQLIALGLTPYTVYRHEAFALFDAIRYAWWVFEAVRPSAIGTDIDLPPLPTNPDYWEHIASRLRMIGSTGGNPSAEVRRAVCGMDMTEHKAKKMLLPLARSVAADWAAYAACQAAISRQDSPKSNDDLFAFLEAATRDTDEAHRRPRAHDAAGGVPAIRKTPRNLARLHRLQRLAALVIWLSHAVPRDKFCNRLGDVDDRRHGLYRTRRPARAPPSVNFGQHPVRRG